MSKVKPGEQIIYIGYDQRRTNEGKVWQVANAATTTAVGSAMNEGGLVDFIEFQGEGIPGYSGGPVFNQDGELIGVMREAWTKRGIKGGPEVLVNRAFSIHALEQLEKSLAPPTIPPVTGATNHAGAVLLDVFDVPKSNGQ